MKERPILFSAPMVRALLDGSKTQTRRMLKPQPEWTEPATVWQRGDGHSGPGWYAHNEDYPDEGALFYRCPYGQPGDRLWVREAWRTVKEADDTRPRDMNAAYRLWYEADAHADHHAHQLGYGKVRPSMFMPRWASRITLEITAVRVERLQDISPADAIAEGIESTTSDPGHWNWRDYLADGIQTSAIMSYASLWESINGPGSWDANPWVWVIEFKRSAS